MSLAVTSTGASFSHLLVLLVLQLAMVPDFQKTLVRADDYSSADCGAILKSASTIRNKPQSQLPTCTCGDSQGSMSSITFYDSVSRVTTTLSVCSGCSGSLVPFRSSDLCDTAPESFNPFLNLLCRGVIGVCKSITFYRCSCPATTASTIPTITIPTITIPTITIPTTTITTPDPGTTGIVGDTLGP